MKEIIVDDITYYIGENAKDNWDVLHTTKKQNMNWLWFHLDKLSSPYVVLSLTKNDIKKEIENHI